MRQAAFLAGVAILALAAAAHAQPAATGAVHCSHLLDVSSGRMRGAVMQGGAVKQPLK